jgi:hypothetical protein
MRGLWIVLLFAGCGSSSNSAMDMTSTVRISGLVADYKSMAAFPM